MTYHMIVFVRFFVNLFSKWILSIFKKRSKSTRQILKVDILSYKNQLLKTIYTKFQGLAEKSCLAIRTYFLYYEELTIKLSS